MTEPATGVFPRFAGTNRHLRTALIAASSRRFEPLVRCKLTLLARPAADTLTMSNAVPSSPRRFEIRG